jgi:prolyl 4-hydroxylase
MEILEAMEQQAQISNWDIESLPNFLTEQECKNLIGLGQKDLKPSEVGTAGERSVNDFRKSQTTALCDCSKQVMALKNKIADHLGVHIDQLEGLQYQYYKKGGYFKEHADYFDAHNMKKFGLASGNRIKTLMIYLNQDLEGGETMFKAVDRAYMPLAGWGLTWDNVDENGKIQRGSKHSAEKVAFGEKHVITSWIREHKWQPEEDERLYQEWKSVQDTLPPLYGNKAFSKVKTPKEVTNIVTSIMMKEKDNATKEKSITQIEGDTNLFSLDKYPEQKARIHEVFRPLAEKLSRKRLEPSFIYGLREYKKGAKLEMHRDQLNTHSVSFSVCYFKDKNWPIVVEGLDHDEYSVELEPGESLYYLGDKFEHGRPTAFEGESYINFYVHYKIKEKKAKKIKPNSHIKMI